MTVDNSLYDRLADRWWDASGSLYALRSGLNPVRVPWLTRTIGEVAGRGPRGLALLDVGCGGGLLAEELAALGARVTGVDPSRGSLRAARAHAQAGGLEVEYVYGRAERLPFGERSFDVVCACDVLEHVEDVNAAVREVARVLRPGGVFLFDTINRTRRSRVGLICLMQEWRLTRCLEPGLHDWRMFIRPPDLARELIGAGLQPGPITGFAPGVSSLGVLGLLLRRRWQGLDYEQLGRGLAMRESWDTSTFYAGYAVKRARGDRRMMPAIRAAT